jgi:hypothetical protein
MGLGLRTLKFGTVRKVVDVGQSGVQADEM